MAICATDAAERCSWGKTGGEKPTREYVVQSLIMRRAVDRTKRSRASPDEVLSKGSYSWASLRRCTRH